MRCFLAIPVSSVLRQKCVELQARLQGSKTKLKLVAPQNFHFTLKFLGDLDEEGVQWVKEQLQDVIAPAFKARVNQVGSFPAHRPRVLWVGSRTQSLINLQKVIDTALQGRFPGEKAWFGHVTLARVKSRPDEKVMQVLESSIDETMDVKSFVLMQSSLSPEGPHYSEVETYALE